MGKDTPDDLAGSSSDNSIQRNDRIRRLLFYVGAVVLAFLVGLVPMWWKSRTYASERDAAQSALQISTMQNLLANAAIDARRGEYEPARQAASDFFTKLRAESDRGDDSVFAAAQRNNLPPIFAARDDTITLLARSDPASFDRLVDLYTKYRQVIAAAR